MHLAHLRLRDFRNYARLDVDFGAGFHLLLGDNAQGKTNLLEAIYVLASLRSFRGVGSSQLVRAGQKAYFIGAGVTGRASHEVKMYWSHQERKLTLDGQPVRRLTDYYGTLRVVIFCTEDLQLIKGPAKARRRFLDLLLAQTHPYYLPLLQRYTRTLRARNALLKQPTPDNGTLQSFTKELIEAGEQLISLRKALIPKLSPLVRLAYRRIVNATEEFRMTYRPSVQRDFSVELTNSREKERQYKTTVVGPHRDELQLLIDERHAGQFASEGQKRSLAIALKTAQAEYLTGVHGSLPILLIDDVMGELDTHRRSAFFPLLSRVKAGHGQVFMTCTEENWPQDLAQDWHRWRVENGTVTAHPASLSS